jgi:predicted FMN-binding regulatory protein PaiB
VKILQDDTARRRALKAQLDALESATAQADHVTDALVERLLPGIIVFQLRALVLKSTFKLSQQKPLAAQSALAEALAQRGQRALSQLTDGRGGDRHVWPPFP